MSKKGALTTMRKRGLVGTVAAAFLVVALTVILIATYLVTKYYVVVNFQMFRKDQEVLDVRTRAVSTQEYDTLAWKLPQTRIIWSVPFSWGYTDSDVVEMEITHLTDADISNITYLYDLRVINARQCTEYSELMKLYKAYPNVIVDYEIPLSGGVVGPDAASISVTTLTQEDVELLQYMPNLKRIDGTKCRDFEIMEKLEKEHPEWRVTYATSIAGTDFDTNAKKLEVTGAGYEELYIGLAAMPNLESVLIYDPNADSEELTKLREDYPNLEIHWEVEAFGNTFMDDAEEVDISNRPIGSIAAAKAVADKFPNLTKLIVNSDGISNEDMAAYREEVRSRYKVVWTVYFTKLCKARTDETKFMPIEQGEYYFQQKHVEPLRYCEDMVCIDIGHSTVSSVEFAAHMPHLKYLILAWTAVTDISPLSNCKELIYLELDHGLCKDFSPLKGCTALEDLNINGIQVAVSIEPLKELTWLKTLWATSRSYREKQELTEALPDTRVATQEASSASGMGWRNLQNYYDMRDYLGKPYMR